MTELLQHSKYSQILDWNLFKKKKKKTFFIDADRYSTNYWICDVVGNVSMIAITVNGDLKKIESKVEVE